MKLNKKCYIGVLNNYRSIAANSITQVKRLASRFANDNFNIIDKLDITVVDGEHNTDILHFTRINKVCPNNTIERGQWI